MTETRSGTEPVGRIRFIEHQGKRILFHDLSRFANPNDALPPISQSKAIVARQPPRSLLTLTWVEGSHFNRAVIEAMKDLGIHNKPYVRHGAIVGLSAIQRVVFATASQLTGRRLKVFATLDKAKDWLVDQD